MISEWGEAGVLFDELREHNFGYQLYTDGNALYKLTLIDWLITTPDRDSIVWHSEKAENILTTAQHAVQAAKHHRSVWDAAHEALPV